MCTCYVDLSVLIFLQYDEVAEHRKVAATKKRKLDAMEEQWRVHHVHNRYINILMARFAGGAAYQN